MIASDGDEPQHEEGGDDRAMCRAEGDHDPDRHSQKDESLLLKFCTVMSGTVQSSGEEQMPSPLD